MSIPRKVVLIYASAVFVCLAYELAIRVFQRGTSEFAGMLTTLVTLPSSLIVIKGLSAVFHHRPGDTDFIFAATLISAGVINGLFLYMIVSKMFPPEKN